MTPRLLARPGILLVLAALVLARPAGATTVERQSLDSLSSRATLVVRGVVEGLEGHVELQGHPFRLARVRVIETLAGRAPATVFVRLLGGVNAAGNVVAAAGVPDLAVGDEIVVFLDALPPGAASKATRPAPASHRLGRGRAEPATGPPPADQWMPLSLAVGTYRIVREAGEATAVQDEGAAGLRQAGPLDPATAAPRSIALRDLVDAVALRRGRPEPGP